MSVSIRPATLSDSGFIYRLAMDPSVREMSTRSEEFHFADHDLWFKDKLSNGLNRIWVMEVDEVPVGQIRYGRVAHVYASPDTWKNDGHSWVCHYNPFQPVACTCDRPGLNQIPSAEIAISISPMHRGKGYAKDLLTTTEPWARRDLKVDRLVALVLKGNYASMFLFESAGFRRSGEEERMGKQHWIFSK